MEQTETIVKGLKNGAYDGAFRFLYGANRDKQAERYQKLLGSFRETFAHGEAVLFSAPGRTEIGGNHTDHQHGCVLAAAVNLDVICAAAPNGTDRIRIQSEGYDMDEVCVAETDPRKNEENTAAALIRGMVARCKALGYRVEGFDAYTSSSVLKGSGLSSSAAFETALGTMISHLFNGGAITAVEIAKIGQYAENVYFGKPSGLMDQMAASVGGFVSIDFEDTEAPVITPVPFDFASCGHTLCIVDTGGDHADLTDAYAAVTAEMRAVANLLGAEYLRGTDESEFMRRLPEIRSACGDRAVLRAMHFYAESRRAVEEAEALGRQDFDTFKELVIASGRSSFLYLQNVFDCRRPSEQGLSTALAVSEKLLAGRGAWRVHGGGFAGTIQAYVPDDMLGRYTERMEQIFGAGHCHRLAIRPVGGVGVTPELGR